MSAEPCKVEGCEQTAYSRGLCNSHYGKWRRGTDESFQPDSPKKAGGKLDPDIELGPVSNLELGWLVGLLEGEGSFGYSNTERVWLKMTDYDVVERAALLIGRLANKKYDITTTTRNNHPKWKDSYDLGIFGSAARALMRLLHPHMGERRKEQITDALTVRERPKDKSPLTLERLGLTINSSTGDWKMGAKDDEIERIET